MKPRICAAVIDNDPKALREAAPLVDLFELRLDLIGEEWPDLVSHLKKPWIACLRSRVEGGKWQGDDAAKLEKLITAVEMGAAIVDIELGAANLAAAIPLLKKKAKCLVSLHELEETPPLAELKGIVKKQLSAGADICKVITTAQGFGDNLTTLQLIAEFPKIKVVSFAMGPLGMLSRVLSPLVGGYFTYASLGAGKESAPGQLELGQLRKLYGMMKR
ncbi:MAG: type I 3-dehydroquinate dehydratase [Dehalococcoidales bacterium]|nr:type I 3-dehydroquinate dehydratase [Dehalococcoidales bacterium]